MMATTVTTARKPRQLNARRIVERPRLFRILDASAAPVRMLVAPPGYGKTTLAEQWIARDGRQHVWVTARPASADVVALALGIVTAANAIVPGCDERLREHLRAVPSSADDPQILAEIVAEDLAVLPADCWLVLDNYDEIVGSELAERFVEALVGLSSHPLLIASIARPSWVTTRHILRGDVLEVGQTALAMDAEEAAGVLQQDGPRAAGLVALADGWPAVIGLAAVSGVSPDADVAQVPESLYRFFAEEVYSALGDTVQRGLATLSIAPVLDREVVDELLGKERSEEVCSAALRVGILVERGSQLDLHPLCRTFLDDRSAELGIAPTGDDVDRCLGLYWRRRDWDPAFGLITRFELVDAMQALLWEALDDVLETARLATLAAWCSAAEEWGVQSPELALARAELALRRGRHTEAQAQGEAAAASGDPRFVFRGLCVAGRAAHLASREEEALALYKRAESAAGSEAEQRDALWGQLMCASELESPDAFETLESLRSTVRRADIRDTVRAATCGLNFQTKMGELDLTEADSAYELLSSIGDPLVVTAFQSVYSVALGLSARYQEAKVVSNQFLHTARRFRLGFALPYAYCSVALASGGPREWEQGERALRHALALAKATRNAHAQQMVYSLAVRLALQRGRIHEALATDLPPLEAAIPSMRAEVLLSRALMLALVGRDQEAQEIADRLEGVTQAIEPRVLGAIVRLLVAMHSGRPIRDGVEEVEDVVFGTGAVDLLVCSYRASPELLAVMLRGVADKDRLHSLIRRVGDTDVAATAGYPIPTAEDPRAHLSRREREVYELLLNRLSNKQIADLLFISEATVKVHVHKIFDKLGTRSRTALAIQAVLERTGQAAPTATDTTSTDGGS